MKVLVGILVLVNVIFFAVMQWGGDLFATHLSVEAQPPLQAEKIALVNDATLTASAPLAVSSVSQAAVTAPVSPEAVSATSHVVVVPAMSKPEAGVCMAWNDLNEADVVRATAALQSLKLGDKFIQHPIEHTIGFWVFVGPLKDKVAVAQKIAQLKARGVEEYFVVQDEPQWVNTISLGLFKTREAAQNFLASLQAKDVRTAQIGERNSKQSGTQLLLHGLDAATVSKINTLQGKFANSQLKSIACD